MEVTRDRAWATLTRYTTSESLIRHALAVEASVRRYARRDGADEEFWGCTALLHDFDYEKHPTLDEHPQDGAPILREEGYPEELIEAVLSHADHLGLPRDTPLKRTLYACDELSGFIHACGLVRPQGLDGLTPKSVRKKLKQPSFAAGVHRDEVYAGAELLGLELDEHIANVVAALQPIAPSSACGRPRGTESADERLGRSSSTALDVRAATGTLAMGDPRGPRTQEQRAAPAAGSRVGPSARPCSAGAGRADGRVRARGTRAPARVFEARSIVGGIARTVEVDGYRFDLGGHRFFTKLPPSRGSGRRCSATTS